MAVGFRKTVLFCGAAAGGMDASAKKIKGDVVANIRSFYFYYPPPLPLP